MTARAPERAAPDAGTLDLAAFDYELPEDRIAQQALPIRDASRLLVLDRSDAERSTRHAQVQDLPEEITPARSATPQTTPVLSTGSLGEVLRPRTNGDEK